MTLRYKTVEFLEFCSPQVREMHEHWAALRGDRVLPHRDDLDPARITRYLPGIMLVDVLWGPPLDFVYRLVGTREVESRGTDPTGRRVAEAYFAATVEDALENYRYVATARAVLYDCERVSKPGNRYVGNEALFLPFTRDGERVEQILVYSHYEDLWSAPPA
jgi:hypothetical protein